TGLAAVANTIGITDVACFAARTGGVLCVRITRLSAGRTRLQTQQSVRYVRPPSDIQSQRCVHQSSRVRAAAAQKQWSIGSAAQAWSSPGTRWSAPSPAARSPQVATSLLRRRAA